jgi:hypothetical protein
MGRRPTHLVGRQRSRWTPPFGGLQPL